MNFGYICLDKKIFASTSLQSNIKLKNKLKIKAEQEVAYRRKYDMVVQLGFAKDFTSILVNFFTILSIEYALEVTYNHKVLSYIL